MPTKPLPIKFDNIILIKLKTKQFKQYKQAIIKYKTKIRAHNKLLEKIDKIRIVINNTIVPKNIIYIKALITKYDMLRAFQKTLLPTL